MTDDNSAAGTPFLATAQFDLRETHRGRGSDFEAAYTRYREAIVTKPGLLGTVLLRGAEEPNRFVLLTWWRDQRSHSEAIGDLQFFLEINSRFMVLADFQGGHGSIRPGGAVPGEAELVEGAAVTVERLVVDEAARAGYEQRTTERLRKSTAATSLVGSSEGDGTYVAVQWFPEGIATIPAGSPGEAFTFVDGAENVVAAS